MREKLRDGAPSSFLVVPITESEKLRLSKIAAALGITPEEVLAGIITGAIGEKAKLIEEKPTPQQILKTVAGYFEVPVGLIQGKNRTRLVADARHVAMYFLLEQKQTGLQLKEIGALLGGRDHSTVIYGVKKIEGLLRSDGKLAEKVRALSELIKHPL